MNLKKNWKGIY